MSECPCASSADLSVVVAAGALVVGELGVLVVAGRGAAAVLRCFGAGAPGCDALVRERVEPPPPPVPMSAAIAAPASSPTIAAAIRTGTHGLRRRRRGAGARTAAVGAVAS